MSNENEIQEWMEAVAQNRTTKKKLVYDKKTKRMIPVPLDDSRKSVDEVTEFIPEEARRF
ncbi:hypothetical protein [Microcoleus sp. CAWBG640]|uniref:hypothetical protein n=1 Tax=Microcoleus sp. CAWBG640 TaxID=2841653 RepID=UPI00312BBD08